MKVLITGAMSGIGREVALELANRGYKVYLCVHTKREYLNCKRQNKHENIKVMKFDVTNENDLIKVGRLDIDILISHAGVGVGGSVSEVPIDLMRYNFEVNVFANFRLVQVVLKNMIRKGYGKIIVTSSLLGVVPFSFLGVYSATKASIKSMCYALRKELKLINKDISVSVIEPGAYKTGFNQVMLNNKYDFMKDGSYFEGKFDKIRKKENFVFKVLEVRSLDSIVNKYVSAVTASKPKFIYRAPFRQVFFMKLWYLFRL